MDTATQTKATHTMNDDYISLEAAVATSGLHPNTLRRLLREGIVRGRKTVIGGRPHWRVLNDSLRQYLAGAQVYWSERRGPRLKLRRLSD